MRTSVLSLCSGNGMRSLDDKVRLFRLIALVIIIFVTIEMNGNMEYCILKNSNHSAKLNILINVKIFNILTLFLMLNTFFMKLIIVFLILFVNYSVWGQELLFVRVYDSSGKKIEKGYVIAATDSLLRLEVKKEPVNIEITKIGSIKTKRSGGNNILIGSLSGAVLLGIVGALTANPDEEFNITTPAGDGAITGTIFGLLLGGATGAATIPFKNSKTFLINGDFAKWKAFQSYFIEGNDRKTMER